MGNTGKPFWNKWVKIEHYQNFESFNFIHKVNVLFRVNSVLRQGQILPFLDFQFKTSFIKFGKSHKHNFANYKE